MSPYFSLHNTTMKQAVALGAALGTFSYPERDTVHAYVGMGHEGDVPYVACGLHGLIMWRKHHPETMDTHGGPSKVTCGRCRRVLGDALEAA